MTRKDFELIADIVATVDNMNTRNEIALNFVTRLHNTNERFDSVRFLKACQANVEAPPLRRRFLRLLKSERNRMPLNKWVTWRF